MHSNNGGFAYDGFFRYSGVSLYLCPYLGIKLPLDPLWCVADESCWVWPLDEDVTEDRNPLAFRLIAILVLKCLVSSNPGTLQYVCVLNYVRAFVQY